MVPDISVLWINACFPVSLLLFFTFLVLYLQCPGKITALVRLIDVLFSSMSCFQYFLQG